jgi:hypothetical protein
MPVELEPEVFDLLKFRQKDCCNGVRFIRIEDHIQWGFPSALKEGFQILLTLPGVQLGPHRTVAKEGTVPPTTHGNGTEKIWLGKVGCNEGKDVWWKVADGCKGVLPLADGSQRRGSITVELRNCV